MEIGQIYTCSLILDAGQDLENVKSCFVAEFTAESFSFITESQRFAFKMCMFTVYVFVCTITNIKLLHFDDDIYI